MKNLTAYIDQKNSWRAIFKDRKLTLPHDAIVVHGHLEADLSPENLTCDGEADPVYVHKQHQFLTAAKTELEAAYPEYVLGE